VSPIFRHGRLRLYLLKLLDEAPRHGYEVIRLLQDRFMGVYSPSPGTIYPRLARLEEDGLVTHDEVDGRKVYRITEKGREEIRARIDDLAELEDELTESVRDIAREVSEDVRDTVRSLREEITSAARDLRRDGGTTRRAGRPATDAGTPPTDATADGADTAANDAGGAADETGTAADDAAARIGDEAREDGRGGRDWGSQDWGGWADRAAGWQAWGERRGRGGRREAGDRPAWTGLQDWAGLPSGLERLASDFARELRSAAGQAGNIGEGALGDLRNILADALARIRDEVFDDESDSPQAGSAHAASPQAASPRAASADPEGDEPGPDGDERPPG
jgi:DNA-binding PadR family transcriptional regulator